MVVGGDFNEILSRHEKMGGLPRNMRQMNDFREAANFCTIHSLHSVGPKFTWRCNRGGEEILVRLDRFMASKSWTDWFPASSAVNLKPNKSDHLPILIEVRNFTPKKRHKKKWFKFEDSWLLNDDCIRVVESGWDCTTGSDAFTNIWLKISNTRKLLMDWSKSCFGNIKEEIELVRSKLAFFYNNFFSPPPLESRLDLEIKLNQLLQHEHAFWKQRAKVFWLTEGDLNTKFFHQSAKNRRNRNTIKGLFNDIGDWCTSDEDLEKAILEYYGRLFSSSMPSNIPEAVNLLPKIVTNEMNAALTKQFTKDEIYVALKQMHPSKAPGPDGFSPGFYQKFWPLVGNDVTAAIINFMESDSNIQQINRTHVVLIPKVKTPQCLSQLRPISLCNVLYKMGSKVLANRLKPLLHQLISPFQSAFVPGRLISDNSLIAFEIAHFLKRKNEGKVGYGALKLDMSKAYDRVEWAFLESAMIKMGFQQSWVVWIMRCIRTVSYSFILNGEAKGVVLPTRGLRQGDAISPYLFLICAEVLSLMISAAETQNRLHGLKICKRAPSISHLFFADDSFIFFKASTPECVCSEGHILCLRTGIWPKNKL